MYIYIVIYIYSYIYSYIYIYIVIYYVIPNLASPGRALGDREEASSSIEVLFTSSSTCASLFFRKFLRHRVKWI